jgi:hypothetical protein
MPRSIKKRINAELLMQFLIASSSSTTNTEDMGSPPPPPIYADAKEFSLHTGVQRMPATICRFVLAGKVKECINLDILRTHHI